MYPQLLLVPEVLEEGLEVVHWGDLGIPDHVIECLPDHSPGETIIDPVQALFIECDGLSIQVDLYEGFILVVQKYRSYMTSRGPWELDQSLFLFFNDDVLDLSLPNGVKVRDLHLVPPQGWELCLVGSLSHDQVPVFRVPAWLHLVQPGGLDPGLGPLHQVEAREFYGLIK